jgi:hypothetical protein
MQLTEVFIRLIWRKKSSFIGLLLVTLILGLFSRLSYQQFLFLQAQNISNLSVFNEILVPLAGLTVICQLLISLLVSVQLVPSFFASGQFSLLQQANLHPLKLLSSYISSVIFYALWPLFVFLMICLVLASVSDIDMGRLGITVFGLFIINLVVSLVVLAVNISAKKTLLAFIQSVLVLAIIIVTEASLSFVTISNSSGFSWSGVFLPLLSIREGLFVYADWFSYLGWLLLSFSCCYLVICRQYKSLRLNAIVFILIGFIIILASSWGSGQFDFSQNKRSSLTKSIKAKLSKIPQNLVVTAVIDEQTNREEVVRGFKIIQADFPSSQLQFKSRQSMGPKLKHSGEYVEFSLAGLNQSVAYPFVQDVKTVFEAALHQMLIRKQQWITFIEGHGEASPFGKRSSDLSDFYQVLMSMGWPVAVQDLSTTPLISDNTGLVIIAASKQEWTFKEQQAMLSYLNKGGALLLLLDPNSKIPEKINSFIEISYYNGTLVDWVGYQSGTPHPAVVIVDSGLDHSIVNSLSSPLAFPWSLGLKASPEEESSEVIFKSIVNTHKNVWNELNIESATLTFDQDTLETKQSFSIAMSRYNTKNQQKIVVVGDSHFASDSAINNYSNKQFALNLVSWLTNAEITQELLFDSDNSIRPSRAIHWVMNWLFLVVLPFLLMVTWYFSVILRSGKQALSESLVADAREE